MMGDLTETFTHVHLFLSVHPYFSYQNQGQEESRGGFLERREERYES